MNCSINNPLMSTIENIQTHLDYSRYVAGVFVDLKKALDTVDHDIFIKTLEHYGVRCVAKDWYILYMKGRKQFVAIGN